MCRKRLPGSPLVWLVAASVLALALVELYLAGIRPVAVRAYRLHLASRSGPPPLPAPTIALVVRPLLFGWLLAGLTLALLAASWLAKPRLLRAFCALLPLLILLLFLMAHGIALLLPFCPAADAASA